jgi:hypothetical protein
MLVAASPLRTYITRIYKSFISLNHSYLTLPKIFTRVYKQSFISTSQGALASCLLSHIQHLLRPSAKLRKVSVNWFISVCPSVCLSAWKNSVPTAQVFIKFDIGGRGFKKSVEKIQVCLKCDKNEEYFTWTPCAVVIIWRWVLLRMRNVSTEVVEKKDLLNVLRSVNLFPKIVPFMR